MKDRDSIKTILLCVLCLFCLWLFFSCKSPKPVVLPPAEYREKIVERLIPYLVPADSALFLALLECDSLNHVILKEFSEYKSRGMESSFSLSQNKLSYNVNRQIDTVYIKTADTTRVEKIPYPVMVEVPVKVNELTKFQKFQTEAALVAEFAILCYIVFGIKWGKIINIIKNLIKK